MMQLKSAYTHALETKWGELLNCKELFFPAWFLSRQIAINYFTRRPCFPRKSVPENIAKSDYSGYIEAERGGFGSWSGIPDRVVCTICDRAVKTIKTYAASKQSGQANLADFRGIGLKRLNLNIRRQSLWNYDVIYTCRVVPWRRVFVILLLKIVGPCLLTLNTICRGQSPDDG